MDSQVVDKNGQAWNLTLTIANVREIKRDMGIDLFDLSEAGGFVQVAADPQNLGDVVAYLVQPQADRLGVSERKKAKLFAGRHEECVEALKGAFLNFCPPGQAGLMARMFAKAKPKATPKAERKTDQAKPKAGGRRSTKRKR